MVGEVVGRTRMREKVGSHPSASNVIVVTFRSIFLF